MPAKLHVLKFALAGGVITAICIAATTIAGIIGIMGGFSMWNTMVEDIYGNLGYRVSELGVFLGAVYGFIDGFILTWIFAWVYNKLL